MHIVSPEEEALYFAEAARNPNLYDLARLMLLQGRRPEEILCMRAGNHWLFPPPRKAGRYIVKLNNAHMQVCLDAGVSFVLYDLRHTFATRQLTEVGADLGTVADLPGHAGLRVVAKYIHPRAKSKSEAMKKHDRMLRAALKAAEGSDKGRTGNSIRLLKRETLRKRLV